MYKYVHKTTVILCPDCQKERHIQIGKVNDVGFTGLCTTCNAKRTHKLMKQRTLSERPRVKNKQGYSFVRLPENHWCKAMATQGQQHGSIQEHRLVMAEYLGRLLAPKEIVHHINGIKDDNRIANLTLVTKGNHPTSYASGYQQGIKDALVIRDKELEKQIKLLQWQIKELGQQLQIKLESIGV